MIGVLHVDEISLFKSVLRQVYDSVQFGMIAFSVIRSSVLGVFIGDANEKHTGTFLVIGFCKNYI